MRSICVADFILFDPLIVLIRVGVEFAYNLSHKDLEEVIFPTPKPGQGPNALSSTSKLINAMQQRIVLEQAKRGKGKYKKGNVVTASQLAAEGVVVAPKSLEV